MQSLADLNRDAELLFHGIFSPNTPLKRSEKRQVQAQLRSAAAPFASPQQFADDCAAYAKNVDLSETADLKSFASAANDLGISLATLNEFLTKIVVQSAYRLAEKPAEFEPIDEALTMVQVFILGTIGPGTRDYLYRIAQERSNIVDHFRRRLSIFYRMSEFAKCFPEFALATRRGGVHDADAHQLLLYSLERIVERMAYGTLRRKVA